MTPDRGKEHRLFLTWLLLLALMLFGAFLAWDQGLFSLWARSDQSRISYVMAVIFLLGTAGCGWQGWRLSRAQTELSRLVRAGEEGVLAERMRARAGLLGEISWRLLPGYAEDGESGVAALERHIKGGHEWGWFVADAMFKLGLLGTVVGFILMLGSVTEIGDLDVAAIQELLVRMSEGMRVALYTTLTGLLGGMLLALQMQLLDRGAEQLVSGLAWAQVRDARHDDARA
ncbi:MAG: MotA/TolQ/ExbB proton channel family protein [Gammaproteobacteria bacterium]